MGSDGEKMTPTIIKGKTNTGDIEHIDLNGTHIENYTTFPSNLEEAVSADYHLKSIEDLGNEIIGKFDDFLIMTNEEESELAHTLRNKLESFIISTQNKLKLKSQVSSTDWEFIS
ncbi:MAG: hypothetical protein AB1665_02640, partial [Candidatus Thermoplasmatota archaeon]